MSIIKASNIIKQKRQLGIKPGLDRVKRALKYAGDPQNKIKIIHIAGTNGKGTAAFTIADYLMKSGLKAGMFTSPWVVDYTEQIQINGNFIDKSVLADYVCRFEKFDLTEFELLSVIMYQYFYEANVDWAVVECGMGGLNDATNTEDTNLSVLTAISIDHTKFLGSSIEDIAYQKAGIIKPNSCCVLYPNALCEKVIESVCYNRGSKLIKVSDHQNVVENTLETAAQALSIALNKDCTDLAALVTGPARQEKIGGIILDGGHNPQAAAFLKEHINNEIAVIGMMADKDVGKYMSIVAPKCKKIITTTPSNPRAMPALQLKSIAKKYCDDVISVDDPAHAVALPGVTLVCGSFFLAADVRKILLDIV